jgi:hypothetical protein
MVVVEGRRFGANASAVEMPQAMQLGVPGQQSVLDEEHLQQEEFVETKEIVLVEEPVREEEPIPEQELGLLEVVPLEQ